MSLPPFETVEIEPSSPADAAVILMHGLGADGHDFEPMVGELRLAPPHAVRFVFPHAPMRAVTINGGFRMRAWYDIVSLDARAEDEQGIRASAAGIHGLIEREQQRGISPDRIVVAGFSQGGALALHTGLREPARLGGVIALSTYLPVARTLAAEAHPANAAVPLFMAHGSRDDIVPLALGEGSRDLLQSRGYDVEWHTYPIAHSIGSEELGDLRRWLTRVVPARV